MLDFQNISVVAIKNKYLGDAHRITDAGSPGILMNLRVALDPLPPLVFEVQVYMDAFLTLKTTAHKTYEFTRSRSPSDLLRPIFETVHPDGDIDVKTLRKTKLPGRNMRLHMDIKENKEALAGD